MVIGIGCDHIGLELKDTIIDYVKELGHEVKNYGTDTPDRTDYYRYSQKVGKAVLSGEADRGIVICGTGVGVSMAANKIPGIRCVLCSDPYTAMFSRMHTDTNVLAYGSRVIGSELAKMITKMWLEAEFDGGRHSERLKVLARLEQGEDVTEVKTT